MIGALLTVGGRRVLRGIVLWVILAILLWIVLGVVLWVVLGVILRVVLGVWIWVVLVIILLWAVSLQFLTVASERHPREAPLWRRVLVRVALLWVLGGLDASHICLCNLASSAHVIKKERRGHDQESGSRNTNTCAGAQPIPANPVTETKKEG